VRVLAVAMLCLHALCVVFVCAGMGACVLFLFLLFLCFSASLLLCCSAARLLGRSAARLLGRSAARPLGRSAARLLGLLGCSAAWLLGCLLGCSVSSCFFGSLCFISSIYHLSCFLKFENVQTVHGGIVFFLINLSSYQQNLSMFMFQCCFLNTNLSDQSVSYHFTDCC